MTRDLSYLGLADTIRSKSLDPNTQIGAVIVDQNDVVLTTGYNRFPRGIQDTPERWDRPLKYQYVVHAEHNAILTAAWAGIPLEGTKIYIVGMGPPTVPCVSCAKAIIQAGIRTVIGSGYKPATDGWDDILKQAADLLSEAGIEFIEVPYSDVQAERGD
jgi:dCMP deaminase